MRKLFIMKKFDEVYNTIMQSIINPSQKLDGQIKLKERHEQPAKTSVMELKDKTAEARFKSMSNSSTKIEPVVGVRGPFKSKQDNAKVLGAIKPTENSIELVKNTIPTEGSVNKYASKIQDQEQKDEMFKQAKQIAKNSGSSIKMKENFKGLEKIK